MFESLQSKTAYKIAAVSYPLEYLTRRITGESVEVFCPGGQTAREKNWQPSPEQVAAIQSADVLIANGPGAPYADWLNRVTVPEEKICYSVSELSTRDFILVKDLKIVHQHGPEGEHTHPYMVPQCWLDPAIASKQAAKIHQCLLDLYPELSTELNANFESLQSDLAQLSNQFERIRSSESSIAVISLNPKLKFLTRAAGIEDSHLLWFDDVDEGDRKAQFEALLKQTRDGSNGPVIVLRPSRDELGIAQTLGDSYTDLYDVNEIQLDSMDIQPVSGDYLTVMNANLEALSSLISVEAAD